MIMEKLLSLALVGVLLFSSNALTTENELSDENTHQTEETVEVTEVEKIQDINVNLVIEFSAEDAEIYKHSLKEALSENKENLINEVMMANNASKKDCINEIVDEIGDFDLDALFETDGDFTNMVIQLSDMQVSIDDIEVELNEDGVIEEESLENFAELEEIINEENTVDVILDGVTGLTVESEIEKIDDAVDINCKISFDDFAEGIVEMSNNMAEGSGQKTTNVYPAKVKVGTYLGAGAGKTKVYFDTNIVGCNKHDKNLNSITTKEFAIGNSDCALSVKYGLVALADTTGILKAYYANSVNCVIEGMTSITGENEENIYCNGKKKSGGHVNCSWFNGIGHSERFHYHKYS